jgi:hypothetical protein
MSPQSGIDSGSTINDLLDAILRRLDSIEEKLQPLKRHLTGVGGAGDGTRHADDGSDVPSGGDSDGDGTTQVISMSDILATGGIYVGVLDANENFGLDAGGIYDDGLAVHKSGGGRTGLDDYGMQSHKSGAAITGPHASLACQLWRRDCVPLVGPILLHPLQAGPATIDSSPHLNDPSQQISLGSPAV